MKREQRNATRTLRDRRRRIVRIIGLIGPRPVMLARTAFFLVRRNARRRQLRRLYELPLPPGRVDLKVTDVAPKLLRAHDLPHELAPAIERLRAEAEAILGQKIDLLGSGLVELGSQVDWHCDFKSGYRWPEVFYQDVEVTRLSDSSDAKVPWELSRCHHLLTLARGARLFEDERYAREFARQLVSWLDANPPGVGINWTNPMEVGIRAVNLVWALAALEAWRPLEPAVRTRLIDALRWHGRHIEANLEGTPYLRSNHYLGDILGLLTLGATLRGETEGPRWLRFALDEFEREIRKQVNADGGSFEASLSYHGLALELFLLARHVAGATGNAFSSGFDDQIRRMLDVSRAVRHPDGRIPLFGDQDSGRVLPAGFQRPPSHDNLLWLGSILVLGERPVDGIPHEEVAWTLGLDAWRRAAHLPRSKPVESAGFPSSGLYVLGSRRMHLVARCGDVGQNGSGGHAHNDMLSYELSVDGSPLVVDSGTYAYTFDLSARNELRSTKAHNTVVVDGAEIHPIDPERVFELRQLARPTVDAWSVTPDRAVLQASHDGYRRLRPSVLHRRTFDLDRSAEELLIRDEILGEGDHLVESMVHLHPGTEVTRLGPAEFALRRGEAGVTIGFVGRIEATVDEGWVSDRYGFRERASVLIARARVECPAVISYAIRHRLPDRRPDETEHASSGASPHL